MKKLSNRTAAVVELLSPDFASVRAIYFLAMYAAAFLMVTSASSIPEHPLAATVGIIAGLVLLALFTVCFGDPPTDDTPRAKKAVSKRTMKKAVAEADDKNRAQPVSARPAPKRPGDGKPAPRPAPRRGKRLGIRNASVNCNGNGQTNSRPGTAPLKTTPIADESEVTKAIASSSGSRNGRDSRPSDNNGATNGDTHVTTLDQIVAQLGTLDGRGRVDVGSLTGWLPGGVTAAGVRAATIRIDDGRRVVVVEEFAADLVDLMPSDDRTNA